MTTTQKITLADVEKVLIYDPSSGHFRWKRRTVDMFDDTGKRRCAAHTCANWNGAWSGKIAGSVNKTHGYIEIGIWGRYYKAHRLAWLFATGEFPSQIDHINGDRTDNRLVNLRVSTQSQNRLNSKVSSRNKTGIKGVSQDGPACGFRARIVHRGSILHLGTFGTAVEADQAYREAEKKLRGEYARSGR